MSGGILTQHKSIAEIYTKGGLNPAYKSIVSCNILIWAFIFQFIKDS